MSAGAGLLAGLAALAQPILARVLVGLGMSVMTTTGVALAVDKLKSLVLTSASNGVGEGLLIAGLAGVWDGLAMVFGAVTFATTYWALSKAVRVVGAA